MRDSKTFTTVAVSLSLIVVLLLVALVAGSATSQPHDTADVAEIGKVKDVTIILDGAERVTFNLADEALDEVQVIGETVNVVNSSVENPPSCVMEIDQLKANAVESEIKWIACDNGTTQGVVNQEVYDAFIDNDSPELVDSSAMGAYLLSTLYSGSNYSNSTFTIVTSYSTMCIGAQYWLPSLNPWNWSNVTSSVRTRGNCQTTELFANVGYGGSSTNNQCSKDCLNLGAEGFDNNAESVQVR